MLEALGVVVKVVVVQLATFRQLKVLHENYESTSSA